ncbi:hypothetical protein CWI37_0106p0010 [Hamiltosporidium tvaerminnensis]|nr:hypothetical protein CWI36_1211p0010 [Hamiltosporidium magnivora]TBU04646.1 hypothetical protein CWI37_0106p0010 [Hamiltosporidium tvaerminnensis]
MKNIGVPCLMIMLIRRIRTLSVKYYFDDYILQTVSGYKNLLYSENEKDMKAIQIILFISTCIAFNIPLIPGYDFPVGKSSLVEKRKNQYESPSKLIETLDKSNLFGPSRSIFATSEFPGGTMERSFPRGYTNPLPVPDERYHLNH